MTIRMAVQLAALATSVTLTNLPAADRAGERTAGVETALTRPDKSGHPLPEGEGREASIRASRAVDDFDAWHARFSARLEESIQQLRANAEREKTAALIRTPGRTVEADREPALTSSRSDLDGQDRFRPLAGILRENGLPPSLVGVVAVESGFNPLALSPKGARGLWQLMPATARRYGLVVGPLIDERTDPAKSTQAAAAYIRDLFAQFQDWPLALAAYNAGEERVARAIDRTGARDFWTLRRHAALPDETLRYVPAVLAKVQSPPFQASDFPWPAAEPASPPSRMGGLRIRGQILYAESAQTFLTPDAD